MLTREQYYAIADALSSLPFADECVVVGSAALFALDLHARIPPHTQDVDVSLPEELLLRDPQAILGAFEKAAFERVGATATWILPGHGSCDLLTHGDPAQGDRIGGSETLRAMLFEDLSRVIAHPAGVVRAPRRLPSLSPAGFCASKLATLRVEKGAKDKLQALGLMGTRAGDPAFESPLVACLKLLDPGVREDLLPECQAALAAIQSGESLPRAFSAFQDPPLEGFRRLAALEPKFR